MNRISLTALPLLCLFALGSAQTGCTLGLDLDNSSIEDRSCTPGSCPSGQVCSNEGFCVPGNVDVMTDQTVDTAGDVDPPDMTEDTGQDTPPSDLPDNRGDVPVVDVPEDLGMCGASICGVGDSCCQCAATICEAPKTCCFRLNVGLDCTDTDSDPENCGGCGMACGFGESCDGGSCACGGGAACTPGTYCCDGTCVAEAVQCECGPSTPCTNATCCGGVCVDTNSNPNHCSACFMACGNDQSCDSGTCVP